jgi:hypothetical protein
MHGTKDWIDKATSLPSDKPILVVDALLKTINSPNVGVDAAWGTTTQQRLEAFRSGDVHGDPSDQVFEKIRGRFD